MLATRQTPLFECVSPHTAPPYHSLTHDFSVLAEDAIRSAIRDYRSKRKNIADGKTKQAGFIDVSANATTGETTASHSAPSS